jgi:hypothetical protein
MVQHLNVSFLHNDTPGMIMTLVILFVVHGRQREDERERRLQYWREQVELLPSQRRSPLLTRFTCSQNAFRQNILNLHATAQASLVSGSASRRSVVYSITEDMNAPILQHAAPEPKSSRLRHPVCEERSSFEGTIENEHLVMRTPYMHNRI